MWSYGYSSFAYTGIIIGAVMNNSVDVIMSVKMQVMTPVILLRFQM
ncbi:MAG: hypothetical protein IPG78_08355 [Ignavibacteria bacterium]|nr:hypothetical protein [Ignavibacteria bacterium]